MKKFVLLSAALLLLAGCSRPASDEPAGVRVHYLLPGDGSGKQAVQSPEQPETYQTGCARNSEVTRAGDEITKEEETLQLKYSAAGLVFIQHNAQYNCGINLEGMTIKTSVEGGDVRITTWVNPLLKCMCPVEIVQVVVSGLRTGKEYMLYFNECLPIQFKYTRDLDITIPADNVAGKADK